MNRPMNEQPAEGSATLAGRADGGEGDGAKGEIKIRRRTHDRRVVAAKFQNGPGKALGQTRRNRSAHGLCAAPRDKRYAWIVDQYLADFPSADQHCRKAE